MQPINPSIYDHELSPAFIQRIAKKAGVSMEVAKEALNYFQEHHKEWNDQLHNSAKDSLLLRHKDTKLPLTIEYWKTGELLVHTKKSVGSGGQKKVMVSIDLLNRQLLARVKGEKETTLSEAHLTDLLSGRGIVKKYKDSYYLRKDSSDNAHKSKYAMILELYDGTIDQLDNFNLRPEDIQHIVLDLAIGLAELHEKDLLHNDYKQKNIFYKIDTETGSAMVVLGDFGSTLCKSEMNNSVEDNQRQENLKTERMVYEILRIYKKNNVVSPLFLEDALLINALYNTRDSNKTIYNFILKSLQGEKLPVPPS
jgi:serine/threonine protein kinase